MVLSRYGPSNSFFLDRSQPRGLTHRRGIFMYWYSVRHSPVESKLESMRLKPHAFISLSVDAVGRFSGSLEAMC